MHRWTADKSISDLIGSTLADPFLAYAGALYALAGADGIFIAHEIGGDDVDMLALFETHAHAVADAVPRARSTT